MIAAPTAAYGPSHLAAIAVLAVGIGVILAYGRWARRRVDRAFAIAIVATALPMQLVQFAPAQWDLQTSLPLQLCDLAWVVAVIALWTRSRLAATICYFWGLTLTTQAVVTPALTTPFPEMRWWLFWAMHLLVVWAAVYVVWAMKLLPTWRTYLQALTITVAWATVTFTFNVLVGTNYGYLNGKPDHAQAVDLLGPWPSYLFVEVVMVAAVWALLTWPWTRRDESPRLVLEGAADEGGRAQSARPRWADVGRGVGRRAVGCARGLRRRGPARRGHSRRRCHRGHRYGRADR